MRPEGFIVSIKKTIIRSLRAGIDDDLNPEDPLLKVKGNIDMEYPSDEIDYPGIWVQFSFSELKKSGIFDLFVNESNQRYQLWTFKGRVTLNIVALSSKERDRISESIVEMYAFHDIDGPRQDFWEEFDNNEYIYMSADRDDLHPGGQTVTVGAPWNPDLLVYEDTYSFDIIGQFASDPNTTQMVLLSRIDIVPEGPNLQIGEWQ